MRKRLLAVLASSLVLCLMFGTAVLAKEVTVKGSITALEDEGKQLTLKGEDGKDTVFKFSSKRTKVMKGDAPASKKDVTVGKNVSLFYDDENEAKEIKVLTLLP